MAQSRLTVSDGRLHFGPAICWLINRQQAMSWTVIKPDRKPVRVIKGKRIGWPRGENAEYIFTVGNARPLDQALQHATTEMLRWLKEDYGLDTTSASLLLGQCVEYDLGNVFDPAYTMVCKLHKLWLAAG